MATKRRGPAGIFQGTPRTPYNRQGSGGLPASHSAGYSWDILSDVLTWSPNAAPVLGVPARDLPRTGRAFGQIVEPKSGIDRREAITAPAASNGCFETRYA